MNKLFTFLVLVVFTKVSFSQLNLYPKSSKDTRKLKHLVLNNTDHFYLGMETGIVFLLGEPTAITQGAETNLTGSWTSRFTFRNNYSFLETSKLYIGYAYKSHYFELATGGILGKMAVYDASATRVWVYPTLYGTLMFRYYYRLPIKSNFIKLLLGAELGWAYRVKSIFEDNNNTETKSLVEYNPINHNLMGGINTRLDMKLAKNCTFNFQVNFSAAFPNRSEFRLLDNPSDQNSTYSAYLNSIMNLNISFGLKFDFYSKKKKQQTFEKLGIEDPYKK